MNGIRNRLACVIGGMLLATLSCRGQGTGIYHNAGDVSVRGTGLSPQTFGVDMDGNGTEDFVFEAYSSFQVYSTTGGKTVGIPAGGTDLGSESIPLREGFTIQSVLGDPLQWTGSVDGIFGWYGARLHTRSFAGSSGYWNPQLPDRLTAYVGVEFNIGDDVNYGWIQVTVGGIGNGGFIKDWAYNTVPGEMILAGQVPEPSTWALLIGGGAVFWWRYRRTRSSARVDSHLH